MFLPQLQNIKQSPMKLGKVFIENVGNFNTGGKAVNKIATTTGRIPNELLVVFQEHESTRKIDERVWCRVLCCKSPISTSTLIDHTLSQIFCGGCIDFKSCCDKPLL